MPPWLNKGGEELLAVSENRDQYNEANRRGPRTSPIWTLPRPDASGLLHPPC